MNKIRLFFFSLTVMLFCVPMVASAADDDTGASRKEVVRKSIKNVVKRAADINPDSIRQVARIVSDEFSDTLFEWENNQDWDAESSTTGLSAGKVLDALDESDSSEAAIAIFVIFAIFAFPLVALILIIWIIAWFSTRKSRDRNRVVAMSIERGIPLPPDYFRSAKSRLQSGLVWIMWGIGIAVFFLIVFGAKSAAVLGLIPILVGGAKLITYFVEDRPQKRD